MRIAVPRETAAGERRVGLAPEHAARLAQQGHEVRVERGAGAAAGFPDDAYVAAGALLAGSHAAAVEGAEVVARVRAPRAEDVEELPAGALLVGLIAPGLDADLLARLAARRVTALAMERVPRHHARAVDGRALVAGDPRRLQGGDPRGRGPAAHPAR